MDLRAIGVRNEDVVPFDLHERAEPLVSAGQDAVGQTESAGVALMRAANANEPHLQKGTPPMREDFMAVAGKKASEFLWEGALEWYQQIEQGKYDQGIPLNPNERRLAQLCKVGNVDRVRILVNNDLFMPNLWKNPILCGAAHIFQLHKTPARTYGYLVVIKPEHMSPESRGNPYAGQHILAHAFTMVTSQEKYGPGEFMRRYIRDMTTAGGDMTKAPLEIEAAEIRDWALHWMNGGGPTTKPREYSPGQFLQLV